MFRGDNYIKPKPHSIIGSLFIAVLVGLGGHVSSMIGYFVALLSLVMLAIATNQESIWPKQSKAENTIVFSLLWGCILGALLPFLISIYLEGGFETLYEMLSREA